VLLTLQLSAGTRHGLPSYNKSIVCSVAEALRLGADAVAVHVNIGNDLEDRMLADFGMVTDEAHGLGLPVMAVIYARGGQIVNELDPSLVAHCIRLGGELGADLVCTPYSAEPQSFSQAVASCPAPVLAAGGPGMDDYEGFLAMAREALELGVAGICAGRNVFQQPDPVQALARLVDVVHGVAGSGPAGCGGATGEAAGGASGGADPAGSPAASGASGEPGEPGTGAASGAKAKGGGRNGGAAKGRAGAHEHTGAGGVAVGTISPSSGAASAASSGGARAVASRAVVARSGAAKGGKRSRAK
jgi:class I fructose-bisphosphate aldolase